jgi:ATP/ADP translocase
MSGYVQASVNLLGFLIQAFLVSRVFKWIGIRGALFILPIIALGSYSMIALLPILAMVRVAKVVENSTDYSIQNTARHALFLPTSREAKYNAKQAIDAFFWRLWRSAAGRYRIHRRLSGLERAGLRRDQSRARRRLAGDCGRIGSGAQNPCLDRPAHGGRGVTPHHCTR